MWIVADHIVAQPGEAAALAAPPRVTHANSSQAVVHSEPAKALDAGKRWRNEHAVYLGIEKRAR
jgi:hypothetical protein